MSLRNKLACDGYGPTVSDGVTAHAVLPVVGVVVLAAVALAAEAQPNPSAAPAAPNTRSTSRRLTGLAAGCVWSDLK